MAGAIGVWGVVLVMIGCRAGVWGMEHHKEVDVEVGSHSFGELRVRFFARSTTLLNMTEDPKKSVMPLWEIMKDEALFDKDKNIFYGGGGSDVPDNYSSSMRELWRILIRDAIPAMMEFVNRTVRVMPVVASNVVFRRFCEKFDKTNLCCLDRELNPNICGTAAIPTEHLDRLQMCANSEGEGILYEGSNGVADTDLVVYLTDDSLVNRCYQPVGDNNEKTDIVGGACRWIKNSGRSVAGYINLCLGFFQHNFEVFSDDKITAITKGLTREFLKILGLEGRSIPRYRERKGGLVSQIGPGHIIEAGGYYLTLEHAYAAAQEHYAGSNLGGLPMEYTNFLEHYSSLPCRAARDDIMCHERNYAERKSVTTLSMGWLQATGWYQVDANQASEGLWGRSFDGQPANRLIAGACMETFDSNSIDDLSIVSDAEWICPKIRPETICDTTHERIAHCDIKSNTPEPISINEALYNNCSIPVLKTQHVNCKSSGGEKILRGHHTAAGEIHGENSRCLMNSIGKSSAFLEEPKLKGGCYETECIPSDAKKPFANLWDSIRIKVYISLSETETLTCWDSGQIVDISHPFYVGSIVCPNIKRFCSNSPCKNGGRALDGMCHCGVGYMGDRCQFADTQANRGRTVVTFSYGTFSRISLKHNAFYEIQPIYEIQPTKSNDAKREYVFRLSPHSEPLPAGLFVDPNSGAIRGKTIALKDCRRYVVWAVARMEPTDRQIGGQSMQGAYPDALPFVAEISLKVGYEGDAASDLCMANLPEIQILTPPARDLAVVEIGTNNILRPIEVLPQPTEYNKIKWWQELQDRGGTLSAVHYKVRSRKTLAYLNHDELAI